MADLPPGFSLEKDDSGDGSDVTVSSKDSRCAKLVAYTNADNPPGSKASAGQSYSGGAQGPFVDESIDAMGSPAAARALQKSFKQAISGCRTMTLKVPGEGSSPISVREVSAPTVGTDPVAVRFTATAGALQGFEVTMVTVAVNDVIVAVTVINGLPEDLEGATTAAVEKAQATLGAARSGT
ncbi:sensor domain-containing protein [Kribbella sp. NPDC055110]